MAKGSAHPGTPPSKNGGYTDSKVNEYLNGVDIQNDRERTLARSAWLHAYSGRKTRQVNSMTILSSGLAVMIGLVSDSDSAPTLAIYALVGVAIYFAIFIIRTWLGRGEEQLEAAAAVLQHRAENEQAATVT